MSIVHRILRSGGQAEGVPGKAVPKQPAPVAVEAAPAAPRPAAEPPAPVADDMQRKGQQLKDGIVKLQQTVESLRAQVAEAEAARAEAEAENARLKKALQVREAGVGNGRQTPTQVDDAVAGSEGSLLAQAKART